VTDFALPRGVFGRPC